MFSPDEILVYLRKSRSDDPLMSVEEVLLKHETILNEWCERNLNGVIPEENRFREIVSGETIADRPCMVQVLKIIENPKIKAILCVEVQRLSRGDLEDAGRLIKVLRYTNTCVITPTKTYDLKDEYDRDIFERELKRGNEYLEYQKKIMSRGRALSVSQGHYLGRPPYGYDKIFVTENNRKCPVLVENKEQADAVRLIFDLYVNKNYGYAKIAKHLDELCIPSPGGKEWFQYTIKAMLTNVHYIGKVKWNWRKVVNVVENGEIRKTRPKATDYDIYEGKHQAIVSEEIFKLAQEKQNKNPKTPVDYTLKNPFAGLLYCRCGKIMTMRNQKQRYKNGTTKTFSRLLCNGQSRCDTSSCSYDEMLTLVSQALREYIADFELKSKRVDNSAELHNTLIKNLEKKLSDLHQKEITQWELQADPDETKRMPQHIFQQLRAKTQQDIENVEKALKNARETTPTPIDYENGIKRFTDALIGLTDDTISAEKKNNLLKACIKKITYHRARAEKTGSSVSNIPIELDIEPRV